MKELVVTIRVALYAAAALIILYQAIIFAVNTLLAGHIKRRERARLVKDSPEPLRKDVGRVYDALDKMGDFYLDSFKLRFAVTSSYILLGTLIAILLAAILLTLNEIERFARPHLVLAALAAFVIYSLTKAIGITRRSNARRRAAQQTLATAVRHAAKAPDQIASWPIWTLHAILLALIGLTYVEVLSKGSK